MKIQTKFPRFVTCVVNSNYENNWKEELHLLVYTTSPEDVIVLVKAAKKYYNLVVL